MTDLADLRQSYYLYEIVKDQKSVLGLLSCIDVLETKLIEHENAHIEKVYKYMQDFNYTGVQTTPVVVGLHTEKPQSLIKTLMLHLKTVGSQIICKELNNEQHVVYKIDQTYFPTIKQLLVREKLYLIDGHHRYNALKINAYNGGHTKLMVWVVTTDDCCFNSVHRVIKLKSNSIKETILSSINLENAQPCSSPCVNIKEEGAVGFYDGNSWRLLPDFGNSMLDSLFKIEKILQPVNEYVDLTYCTSESQIQETCSKSDGKTLLFTLPSFCFPEIHKLTEMRKLLPIFSTFVINRPIENLLCYKHDIAEYHLDKAS